MLAVSGQALVPTLVVGEQMFVDENDILDWLDKTYAPREAQNSDAQALSGAELTALADEVAATMEKVRATAAKAAAAGKKDPGNVLKTASDNLAEAARWMRGQANNVG